MGVAGSRQPGARGVLHNADVLSVCGAGQLRRVPVCSRMNQRRRAFKRLGHGKSTGNPADSGLRCRPACAAVSVRAALHSTSPSAPELPPNTLRRAGTADLRPMCAARRRAGRACAAARRPAPSAHQEARTHQRGGPPPHGDRCCVNRGFGMDMIRWSSTTTPASPLPSASSSSGVRTACCSCATRSRTKPDRAHATGLGVRQVQTRPKRAQDHR